MNKKKSTFQDALMLTDKGYRDLKKAIAACTPVSYTHLTLPTKLEV